MFINPAVLFLSPHSFIFHSSSSTVFFFFSVIYCSLFHLLSNPAHVVLFIMHYFTHFHLPLCFISGAVIPSPFHSCAFSFISFSFPIHNLSPLLTLSVCIISRRHHSFQARLLVFIISLYFPPHLYLHCSFSVHILSFPDHLLLFISVFC